MYRVRLRNRFSGLSVANGSGLVDGEDWVGAGSEKHTDWGVVDEIEQPELGFLSLRLTPSYTGLDDDFILVFGCPWSS
jgi:hypothetical protein